MGCVNMFTVILWAAIIGALIIAFKRIASGITMVFIFIAMVFFAVFMLDTVTTVPIRSYISLGWYDDTIEDPQGTVENVTQKITKGGKKAVDEINKVGKKVDVKYGTKDNKEWTKEESEVTEQEEENVKQKINKRGKKAVEEINKVGKKVDEKYGTKDNKEWKKEESEVTEQEEERKETDKQDKKKEQSKKKDSAKKGSIIYIKYNDVKQELKSSLKDLPKEDKQIIQSMTSIYKTKIDGESIAVWNNKDKSEDGIYVQLK